MSDPRLLELLLSRQRHEHLAACAECAGRLDRLAGELDPLRCREKGELLDEAFYRRQKARIASRLAASEGGRGWRGLLPVSPLPQAAWAIAGIAVLVAVVALLGGTEPRPTAGVITAYHYQVAPQDAADDALLRDIEALLARDPYEFGPEVWPVAPLSEDRDGVSRSGIQPNEV